MKIIKEIIDHWKHKKIVGCVTLVTGLLMAIPTFYLATIDLLLFVIVFPFFFLFVLTLWHEAKDRTYYWWRKRK